MGRYETRSANKKEADALEALRKRLNSRDDAVREQACQDALVFPMELLLELAAREAKRSHGLRRTQEWLGAVGCCWILTLIVTLVGQVAFRVFFPAWDVALTLGFVAFIGLLARLDSGNRLADSLSRIITAQTDARFVAPALLFYHNVDSRPGLHKDMRQTLLRLLPHVTAADMQTWTPAQKAALRHQFPLPKHHLDLWHDLEMMRCVLQTLERVGGTEALPGVQNLAAMSVEDMTASIHPHVLADDRKALYRAILDSGAVDRKIDGDFDPQNHAVMRHARYHAWCRERAEELHHLANRCLTALRERAGQQQQADVLLRAAHTMEPDAAQILLRAQTTPVTETPSEQLLRPGNAE